MFNNVGNKLKKVAPVLFAVVTIGSIIGAIVLCTCDSWVSPLDALGIGVLIIGVFSGWVGAACLYALGSFVSDTEEIKNYLKSQATDPIYHASKSKEPANIEEIKNHQKSQATDPIHHTSNSKEPASNLDKSIFKDSWKCPVCGKINPDSVQVCQGCGQKLWPDE